RSPTCALPQRLWGITRRRSRGVVRVLLEALQQALDGGIQRGNACFEGADILSNGQGRLLPQLRWKRWCGVHGPQSYAGWRPASKSHILRPRERLQRFYEAELWRLKGELLLQSGIWESAPLESTDHHPHAAEAAVCFRQALAVARRQQAKLLELRAVMSL